jgi:hypothetical protein
MISTTIRNKWQLTLAGLGSWKASSDLSREAAPSAGGIAFAATSCPLNANHGKFMAPIFHAN